MKLARRDHEYKELQEAFHKLEEQLHAHKEALNDQKPEEIQPAEPEQKHDYEAEIKALKEKINELQIEINIGDEV